MNKIALVTGAGGFIGGVLCKLLKETTDYTVVGVDIKNAPLWGATRYIDVFEPQDYAELSLVEYEPEVIFHLGASSLLGPSVAAPLDYIDNNASKMADQLYYLVARGWQGRYVFASSAAVYGNHKLYPDLPIGEGDVKNPCNPYGWSKLHGEQILQMACQAHGIKATALRLFNVAGAWDDLGQGEDQPHILTRMTQAARSDSFFHINGDGGCVRDYVHVKDVVGAFAHADTFLKTSEPGTFHALNVGTGIGTSILDLLKEFRAHAFELLETDFVSARKGDPDYLVADANRIQQIFGWEPHHSLKDIITDHYRYLTYGRELA